MKTNYKLRHVLSASQWRQRYRGIVHEYRYRSYRLHNRFILEDV